MSEYQAQSGLEMNMDFRNRVRACVVQETQSFDPSKPVDVIVQEIMPDVVASPGFATKYLYGDQANGQAPGHLAITDAEILATVQPMLDVYRPEVEPPV